MMIKIFITMIALLFLISCSEDSVIDPGIQFTDTIMPLAVDNYWVFADTTYNPDSFTAGESKIGITGFRRVTYDNERINLFFWNWFDMPENTPRQTKTLVNNEAEGLMFYGQQIGNTVSTLERRIYLKYPAQVDDEWDFAQNARIRLISTSTIFPTPLADFECYVYELITLRGEEDNPLYHILGIEQAGNLRDDEITRLYFAPEVGYVGMTRTLDNAVVFRRTLIDYLVQEPEEEALLRNMILSP